MAIPPGALVSFTPSPKAVSRSACVTWRSAVVVAGSVPGGVLDARDEQAAPSSAIPVRAATSRVRVDRRVADGVGVPGALRSCGMARLLGAVRRLPGVGIFLVNSRNTVKDLLLVFR
jgi:hypothetical protein